MTRFLAVIVTLVGLTFSTAPASAGNPIFNGGSVKAMSSKDMQKTVAKGYYSDYYGYYGMQYAYNAYLYGYYGYYYDGYSNERYYYGNATNAAYNAYVYYYYAYYYAGY